MTCRTSQWHGNGPGEPSWRGLDGARSSADVKHTTTGGSMASPDLQLTKRLPCRLQGKSQDRLWLRPERLSELLQTEGRASVI